MTEFIVFQCLSGCFIEEADHEYDQSTAYGPFDNLDDAVNFVIDRMSDWFTPSISYSSQDDGPFEAHVYEPTITEEQVRTELLTKQSYEAFDTKYEIRQLVSKNK